MGIFKRMKQIAAADAHGLLDRFEDPVAMVKQYIREVEEELEKARDALARQLAAEQNFRLLILQTKDTIAKRARQAELAVDQAEDDVAELAIQEKLRHSTLLAEYEEQRAHAESRIDTLQQEIVRLARLHRELGGKLDAILIRAQAAQAVGVAAAAAPTFRTEEIVRNVSRIESRVRRMEAGALASRRLTEALDPLKQWEHRDEVRVELEKLKAERQAK